MCVIVVQPKGVPLTKDVANRLWTINSQGGGFAFQNPDNGKLRAFKTLDWNQFWAVYRNDYTRFGDRVDFVLHMRIATHGSVCIDNCHPFKINDNTMLFHNGVLNVVIAPEDDRSDSRVFAEDYLSLLPANWMDSPWMTELLEDWIGWSKIAILTNHPDAQESLYILNRKEWVEHEGLLLSNGVGIKYSSKPTKYLASDYVPLSQYAKDLKDFGVAGHDWDDERIWDWGHYGNFQVATVGRVDYSVRNAQLRQARKDILLTKPLAYSPSEDTFECLGCDEMVSESHKDFGMCKCFDSWCTDCNRLCSECTCSRGYSVHIVPLAPAPRGSEDEIKPGRGEAIALGLATPEKKVRGKKKEVAS
jgi:glutamine amidotransferase